MGRQRALGPAPIARPGLYDVPVSPGENVQPLKRSHAQLEQLPPRKRAKRSLNRTSAHTPGGQRATTRETDTLAVIAPPKDAINSADERQSSKPPRRSLRNRNVPPHKPLQGLEHDDAGVRSGSLRQPVNLVAGSPAQHENVPTDEERKPSRKRERPRKTDKASPSTRKLASSTSPIVDRRNVSNARDGVAIVPAGKLKRPSIVGTDELKVSEALKEFHSSSYLDASESSSEEEGSLDDTEHRDPQTMYRQGPKLHGIYQIVYQIGYAHQRSASKPTLRNSDVQRVIQLCKLAQKELRNMEHSTSDNDTEDCPSQFLDTRKEIDTLCGKNEENPAEFHSRGKAIEIYSHLIPKLIRLLRSTIGHYEAMDVHQAARERTITEPHLRIVLSLIKMILNLGAGADNYARPPAALAIVRPVKSGILKPLKEVDQAFRDYLYRRLETRRNETGDAYRPRSEARRLEEEQQRQHHQQQVNILRNKWVLLHEERRYVEPGIIPMWKLQHLRFPFAGPEMDHNGEAFERLQVFAPRVGPPPMLIKLAQEIQWTEEETDALCDGLQSFAGPLVFEKTFRKHCKRGGPLNSYSVTEIVTKAAELKEIWQQEGDESAWVASIPVWTRPHNLSGKENERGLDRRRE